MNNNNNNIILGKISQSGSKESKMYADLTVTS